MTRNYKYILGTYILMQLSTYPLLLVLEIANVNEDYFGTIGILWSVFSFSTALIIILLLLKPEKDFRKDPEAASNGMVIVWSISGFFLALFGQGIINYLQTTFLGVSPDSENTRNIIEIARAMPIFIIVVTVIGPILEEIVFRKIIFGSIYKRTNFFIGALASGLIFAIVHNDFPHILTYLTIGFVFAFIYVKSKRIIVPIIAHVSMNTMVIVAQLSLSPEELEKLLERYEKLQMILIGG